MTRRHEYALDLVTFDDRNLSMSVEQIHLRMPEATHIARLAELMLDAYRGTIDYDGETMTDAIAEIHAYWAGERGGPPLMSASRLAFAGERLVSACLVSDWMERQLPLITYVMTAAAWKQHGIGRQTLGAALQALRSSGHVEVRAVITEGNSASERLCESMGFRRVSEP